MLTLLFIGAGVYSLTTTGWLRSLRLCFSESRPLSTAYGSMDDDGDERDMDEPTETRPLVQDSGRTVKTLSKSAAIK